MDEVVQDVTIIRGTLLIDSAPAFVLFDSGSTHMFISRMFVDRIGVFVDDLGMI